MKKVILSICMLAMLGATTLMAIEITGKWQVTAAINDMPPMDLPCVFNEAQGKLNGTCTTEGLGELAITGTTDGKTARWSYVVNYQGQDMTVVYQGAYESASAIKGSIYIMDQAVGTFTAQKVKTDGLPVAQMSPTPTQPASIVLWDEAKLSKAAYKVVVEQNVRVPMRDGVKLAADIYRPDAAGRFPALLLRTPYNKSSADEIRDSNWYAERGYVVVNQDVRGRYASAGTYYAYKNEADDGYDTDEWIAKQPWSDGKIGTLGGSYLGYTQLVQGIRGSAHLTSMATDVTSSDVYHGWTYVDGAFHIGFALPWGAGTMYGSSGQEGDANFKTLPIASADLALGHANSHYRDWLSHPRRSDPYWNGISFETQAHKISVPLLVVAGWFDIFLRGTLQDDIAIRKNGQTELARQNKRLIIGPWVHSKTVFRQNGAGVDFGPAAQLDGHLLYLAWHDHWLKGIENSVAKGAPVKLFVMGQNAWRDEQEWPLARTQYTKYYISSHGKANSAAGDGVLQATAPAGEDRDIYTYDPLDPVPTLGGNMCCSPVAEGMADHQSIETRADVLVYSTPVLQEALEVTGPIAMKLYAATSAKDTDWVVRLLDVYPDGRVMNLQDGILRARYRAGKEKPASLLETQKVYAFDIDLWATSNVFLPGHRMRLEITSSNFPRFDRNLNTGDDPATGTRMEKARQTIYHSAQYPSHVILPIIPRSTAAGR